MSFRFDNRTYHVDADHNTDPYSAARWEERAWVFSFGVYTPPGVIVYGGSLDDALEAGAASGRAGGAMIDGEPDYQDAAEDAGFTLKGSVLHDADGEEVDWNSAEGNEVREIAEADLTYTEAGWLTWEWSVTEIHHGDALYGDGVAAWVEENPDWIDDDDDEIREVLTAAGASESRIKTALAAVRVMRGG